MTAILLPNGSVTFIAALLVPLVLGFLVGVVARAALKIGVAILLIIFILIFTGYLEPSQVIQPIVHLVKSGPALAEKVNQIAGYLPYSTLGFLLGFAVGYLKG